MSTALKNLTELSFTDKGLLYNPNFFKRISCSMPCSMNSKCNYCLNPLKLCLHHDKHSLALLRGGKSSATSRTSSQGRSWFSNDKIFRNNLSWHLDIKCNLMVVCLTYINYYCFCIVGYSTSTCKLNLSGVWKSLSSLRGQVCYCWVSFLILMYMVHGALYMVYCTWCIVHGVLYKVYCTWCMVHK